MKLSEAIRLGATLHPQCFSGFEGTAKHVEFGGGFPWIHILEEKTTCALRAAYEANGSGFYRVTVPAGTYTASFRGAAGIVTEAQEQQVWDTPSHWPLEAESLCPQCRQIDVLKRTIAHLNDVHKWTREAIADFVELHERIPACNHGVSLAKDAICLECRKEARLDEYAHALPEVTDTHDYWLAMSGEGFFIL